VIHTLWGSLTLFGALITFGILAPHLAIAGMVGLISGNWRLWNKWTMGILEL